MELKLMLLELAALNVGESQTGKLCFQQMLSEAMQRHPILRSTHGDHGGRARGAR